MDSGKLTPEQCQRIEANRLKALAKRAEKPEQRQRIEANRLKALAKRAEKSASLGGKIGESGITSPSFVIVQEKSHQNSPAPTVNSSSSYTVPKQCNNLTQPLRNQQEVDARRQKALALRAEKNAKQTQMKKDVPSMCLQSGHFYSGSGTKGSNVVTQGANSSKGNNTLNVGQYGVDKNVQGSKVNVQGNFSTFGNNPAGLNIGNKPNPVGQNVGNKPSNPQKTQSLFPWQPDKLNSTNKQLPAPAGKGLQAEEVAKTLGTNLPAFHKQKTPLKGVCGLISRERFEVNITFHPAIVEIFKSMPTRSYDATSKHWTFKLGDYFSLMEKLQRIDDIRLEPLPPSIRTAFAAQIGGKYPLKHIPDVDLSRVEKSLVQSLMPFQRVGVSFALSKNGRVLLADDMGLGKTIQGICLACYYKEEWPVLVVTPSSVRFAWAEQFKRWVPSLDPSHIKVAVTGSDNDTFGHCVHITSYDLVVKKAEEMLKARFKVVIMDESHLLKNHKTARCQAATPILKAARRVILLSGTPALSRPKELFPQLAAVNSKIFYNFHEFGVRYCDGKKTNYAWDYNGASNMTELQLLMEESCMIRRVKVDVLDQLPEKRREMIVLDPAAVKTAKTMKAAADLMSSGKLKGMERRGCLLSYFTETGKAKIPAVKSYVLDLLESDKKFLVFAHHSHMLDALEEAIKNKGFGMVRIDGRTPSEQRKIVCDKFMFNEDIKVALLSITAASTGLNLTAASMVVFAELFWNPGILTQAEDRVHRIGQRDSVNVQYLVAKHTADDYIWPLVQMKLDVLQSAGLTKDDFTKADTTQMGNQDSKQKTILSYFEEDLFNQSDDDLDAFFKNDLDDDILMQNREGDIRIKTEDPTGPPAKKPKMPATILTDEFDMDKDDWWT